MLRLAIDQAYERLVTAAPSLLPTCDLGPVPRLLFEEWLREVLLPLRYEYHEQADGFTEGSSVSERPAIVATVGRQEGETLDEATIS